MPTPVPSIPLYTIPPGPFAATTSTINPHPSRKTPSGALRRRPQGMFLSTAITAPSTSIQAIFATPTANINNIKPQQQPMQKIP